MTIDSGILRRSVKVGGFFDRHPILTPAMVLSAAWLAYVIVFFRRYIAFGDLGSPLPLDTPGYWALLVLQLVVCVISHSLAVRTIVRLYSPLWLIWGSIAFFALCPMWGMLTAADVRYPLFAMMICVITSAAAFIVYSNAPKRWLWVELAVAGLLVCLLRETGIWSVAPLLICLVVFEVFRTKKVADSQHLRRALIATLAVGAVFGVAILAGLALPIGEPDYHADAHAAVLNADSLVAGVISYADVRAQSVLLGAAQAASHAIFTFQTAPVACILFMVAPYALLYVVFIALAIIRKDVRALIVGIPQMAILAVMVVDPTKATLSFMLPVLAAQIMFFGALLRGCSTIGRKDA